MLYTCVSDKGEYGVAMMIQEVKQSSRMTGVEQRLHTSWNKIRVKAYQKMTEDALSNHVSSELGVDTAYLLVAAV